MDLERERESEREFPSVNIRHIAIGRFKEKEREIRYIDQAREIKYIDKEPDAPSDDFDERRPEREDVRPPVEPQEVAREDPVLRVGDLRRKKKNHDVSLDSC